MTTIGGEFNIIDRYFHRMCQPIRREVIVGMGDDCALLSGDDKRLIAVSTDTLVSGIHFLPDIDPSDLGYKSLAVNLSDLAAMGADPAGLLLAITLPNLDEAWLSAYSDSLFQQLEAYNIQLIGGDTTRGPLSLTLTVYGFIPNGHALTRSGACIGDWIYVTGTLGDSAAGLAILQDQLQVNNEEDRQYLLTRHLRPQPRVSQGIALRQLASATIDLSDGMISDLSHLLSRSNCGARLYLDDIPRSPELERHTTPDQALHWALTGGEDYELCFTIQNVNCSALEGALSHTGVPFNCIGQIIPQREGLKLIYHHQLVQYDDYYGYDHF